MEKRDELISWLNDAYAMERALEITLDKQTRNNDLHSAIRQRAAIHLDETRAHAERIERCLRTLGTEPSTLKTVAATTFETAKKFTTMFASDERVKDYLAATGAEYFEVACYKALIAAAGELGEEVLVPLLEQNLREDHAMAQWLEDNIDVTVRGYLSAIPAGT
ncbi:MAG: ferritin-like domain-containing protein [Chthoniobacterales bacterium]